jgi:hypothetical protein
MSLSFMSPLIFLGLYVLSSRDRMVIWGISLTTLVDVPTGVMMRAVLPGFQGDLLRRGPLEQK